MNGSLWNPPLRPNVHRNGNPGSHVSHIRPAIAGDACLLGSLLVFFTSVVIIITNNARKFAGQDSNTKLTLYSGPRASNESIANSIRKLRADFSCWNKLRRARTFKAMHNNSSQSLGTLSCTKHVPPNKKGKS